MLLWVLDPVGRDAAILNQSLNGDITDLRAATEVICSRTPSQLQIMKQTYRARFGCYLEHDITERTYGDHQKVSLLFVVSIIITYVPFLDLFLRLNLPSL